MNSAAQVLDPCSASRMMWFDKGDQRALFGDIRDEEHVLCDGRVLKVEPDVIMD
ncbi:SAM-dependent methyltransferase, partial [Pseudomonas proteolytica]|nr:SAM-dependent methyltransferase [Pseudomonas proteolytica]